MIRVDRGGSVFLDSVTAHLHGMGEDVAYSPALYQDSTGFWKKSGFEPHVELLLMEHPLSLPPPLVPPAEVISETDPDWDSIHELDEKCFHGFWSMSKTGLREALETNRTSTLLLTRDLEVVVGYAIVGMQLGVAYLHRIAVAPEHGGAGRGMSLLRSAVSWGRAHGGRSMILNVRAENQRAIRLYERAGFTGTGASLVVLRHDSTVLN